MIFVVSKLKKHPEVQGLVCTSPVIDLGPHAICNLTAQTSQKASNPHMILVIRSIPDKSHLWSFVKAKAGC
jgi:hypothetical protein